MRRAEEDGASRSTAKSIAGTGEVVIPRVINPESTKETKIPIVLIVKNATIGIVIIVPIFIIKESVKPVCARSGIGCIGRTGEL